MKCEGKDYSLNNSFAFEGAIFLWFSFCFYINRGNMEHGYIQAKYQTKLWTFEKFTARFLYSWIKEMVSCSSSEVAERK